MIRLPRVLQAQPPPVGAQAYISGAVSSGDWADCSDHLMGLGYAVIEATGDMRTNIRRVCDADFLVVLPGWEFHIASNTEATVARALKMPVLACRTLLPVFLA